MSSCGVSVTSARWNVTSGGRADRAERAQSRTKVVAYAQFDARGVRVTVVPVLCVLCGASVVGS